MCTWRSCLAKNFGFDAKGVGARLDQAERRLSALLHDITQLAGELEFTVARHLGRFDKQYIAADRGPRQPGGDARQAGS